jgi:hypothetical protein
MRRWGCWTAGPHGGGKLRSSHPPCGDQALAAPALLPPRRHRVWSTYAPRWKATPSSTTLRPPPVAGITLLSLGSAYLLTGGWRTPSPSHRSNEQVALIADLRTSIQRKSSNPIRHLILSGPLYEPGVRVEDESDAEYSYPRHHVYLGAHPSICNLRARAKQSY